MPLSHYIELKLNPNFLTLVNAIFYLTHFNSVFLNNLYVQIYPDIPKLTILAKQEKLNNGLVNGYKAEQ